MSLSEFELIRRFFTRAKSREDTVLGIGDDAALVRVPPGMELAAASDTLVEGVHFPRDTVPFDIGYKALAVNLSDLAAMGAEPAWAMLSLAVPAAEESWLAEFARGLFELADRHNVELIGGDTVCGPLSVTVQVLGLVPAGVALRRAGARPGDVIYVTGTLGDAGLALYDKQGGVVLDDAERTALHPRLDRPAPRVAEGLALRGIAGAAIDISDGLLADLGHILEASGVGATIQVERLPLSATLRAHLEPADGWRLALGAGDDYELCFSVAPAKQPALERALADVSCGYTRIGIIEDIPGLRCRREDGTPFVTDVAGYNHFADGKD